MTDRYGGASFASLAQERAKQHRERRIDSLVDRVPGRLSTAIRRLRQPRARWARIPAGILLMICGVFGALPLLGFWMLPLGLLLLAEDLPPLRSLRDRLLDWVERRRPQWFDGTDAPADFDR